MTTEQFAYWLKGFMELSYQEELDKLQVQIIKDHLDLVFEKVTPQRNQTIDLSDISRPKPVPCKRSRRDPTVFC